MFYKYLDTNMFSVVTAAANDPSTITIYLINGVTGRIIYQFQEQNVSPSPSHTIASLFNELPTRRHSSATNPEPMSKPMSKP